MLEYVVLYIIRKVRILQTDTYINVLSTRKHENILCLQTIQWNAVTNMQDNC